MTDREPFQVGDLILRDDGSGYRVEDFTNRGKMRGRVLHADGREGTLASFWWTCPAEIPDSIKNNYRVVRVLH
jgi:hypothetical protein